MAAPAAVALLLALALPSDTVAVARDSARAGPVEAELRSGVRVATDTVRPRRRAVEVSDWYARRLRIHQYGAYAMLPLFALETVAGDKLYGQGRDAPVWAKTGHRVGATGLAAVFGVNTVTGLWNLWDSRDVPQGRARRTVHALLMLASDAGFTYAGARLAEQAENSADKRREHRNVAYASMGAALAGTGVMIFWHED